MGRTARIALRVNPDVDAKTHAKISTGKAENKFGIPYALAPRLYAEARTLPGIDVSGIHMHIGSQITELEPFRNAFRLLRELAQALIRDGHALHHLDIGGGLGVPYNSEAEVAAAPREYAPLATKRSGTSGSSSSWSRAASSSATPASSLARVLYAKEGVDKTFTVIDAAMNDLIRPTLYEAHHEIWPVERGQDVDAADDAGRGRPRLRDRRLSGARPDAAAVRAGRSRGDDDGGCLRSGDGLDLQLAAAGARGAGRWGRGPSCARAASYDDMIGADRVPDWLG